jgi:small subunit ribosomal protein S1
VKADRDKESAVGKKKEKDTKKAVKKLKDNLEKTTLGDLDALANLKADMIKAEERQNEESRSEES